MKRRADGERIRCQCLDFAAAAHRHRVYPLMYCHMELLGHLDAARLKQSVTLSSKAVPELLCAYDFKRGDFVNAGYTADDAVKYVMEQPASLPRLDLSCHPQIKILITPNGQHDLIIAAMSHILADGKGFLQYLSLLAALYNGGQLEQGLQNVRDISPLLKKIHVSAPAEQTRRNRSAPVQPLRSAENGGNLFCLTSQISMDCLEAICRKAKKYDATLNDAFMAAYARVIARLQKINTVILPCPADLRNFYPGWNALTVANMTGIYREIPVEIQPGCLFDATLRQVHLEMELQKSRCRCFAGIKALNRTFHKVPLALLEQAVKAAYRPQPISYTNMGVIRHETLCFRDCPVQSCFFTGAYRLPPDFQLTISTFRDKCTLNCTLSGAADAEEVGRYILDQVRNELLGWIGDDERAAGGMMCPLIRT